jgi:ATP dependent DNA ligase domain
MIAVCGARLAGLGLYFILPGADPVVYCVFDLLVTGGMDVMSKPLQARQARAFGPASPWHAARDACRPSQREGEWLYQEVLALKLEGIVRMKLDSMYLPGARSRDWVKNQAAARRTARAFQLRGPIGRRGSGARLQKDVQKCTSLRGYRRPDILMRRYA